MPAVVLIASISLDGFAADRHRSVERLHRWFIGPDADESSASDPFLTRFRATGAIVFGRNTFDDGQEPWGEDDVFWAPVFIVTHERRDPVVRNGALFTFVDGARAALEAAGIVAGEKEVHVMGSADVARQLLGDGLIDEIDLHVIPVILGAGARLFPDDLVDAIELELTDSAESRGVQRLRYRVMR
ncbi:dihydrofolate reductase family protein [Microbacterium terregens]|uniref:Dihydrofolate reductase family protein n=1 Tax=Microbacterium terregens TaxID=69363 RepID=A0ABV5T1W9_9MICO